MRLPIVFTLLLGAAAARADIATDGSLGPARTLPGPSYRISADLGQRVGGNLFHSFERFGLSSGEEAVFSGPAAVQRVIGRVTGGAASTLDGRLASEIAGADLYLINPAGIVLGPHASIDVPGAVHLSTADHLSLADGGRFDARTAAASALTVAPPAAFGFLDRPAGIRIDRAAIQRGDGLATHVSGGDIAIDQARLFSPGGTVSITGGGVSLTDSAIDVSGGGGRIAIAATDLAMTRSALFADSFGAPAQGIDVQLSGDLTMSESFLTARTADQAAAGAIRVQARRMRLTTGAAMFTSSFGAGPAGAATLSAGEEIVFADAAAPGDSLRAGVYATGGFPGQPSGPAGSIAISAPRLTMAAGSILDASTYGTAAGGTITLAVGDLSIGDGAVVMANTFHQGAAGRIGVAADAIAIAGYDPVDESFEFGRPGLFAVAHGLGGGSGGGDAGSIAVTAERVDVGEGGRIRADSIEAGAAGSVSLAVGRLDLAGGGQITNSSSSSTHRIGGDLVVVAREAITMIGAESREPAFRSGIANKAGGRAPLGRIRIETPALLIDGGSILADTEAFATGGTVELGVGELVIRNGGQIFAGTNGLGSAGDIVVAARSVAITGTGHVDQGAIDFTGEITGIFANVKDDSLGGGGRIALDVADTLTLSRGGAVSTRTSGLGGGGRVAIRTGRLVVDDGLIETAVASPIAGAGSGIPFAPAAGDITISAGHILLTNRGTVSSLVLRGGGTAGDLGLEAERVEMRDGHVLTRAERGDGGNVRIGAPRWLVMVDSDIVASVAGGGGSGGNVVVDTPLMAIADSRIEANAFGGNGGNITIAGGLSVPGPGAVFEASSPLGVSGTITVAAPSIDVSASVAVLPATFLDAAGRLSESCAARGEAPESTLVAGGRGGLPPDPAGPLPAPIAEDDGPGTLALATGPAAVRLAALPCR